jgi:hypothetical protein
MISWRILVSLRGFFFCPLGLFLLLCSIMFSTCSQLCSHCVPQIAPHFIPYSLPKSSHFLTCKWIKGEALPSSHKNCYFGNLPRFYFFGWCANQYGPLKNKLKNRTWTTTHLMNRKVEVNRRMTFLFNRVCMNRKAKVFFSILWRMCIIGNHLQEDLAKFGYRLNRNSKIN